MDRLIEQHLAAEVAGDPDGSVAMYTDDVEHDVVGAPHGPLTGRDAARGFYEQLTREIDTESMAPTRTYHGPDFCVTEHQWTAPCRARSSVSRAMGAACRSGCFTFGSSPAGASAARTCGSTVGLQPPSSAPPPTHDPDTRLA